VNTPNDKNSHAKTTENEQIPRFAAKTSWFSLFAITGEQIKKGYGTQIKPEIRDVKENNKWTASDIEQQSEIKKTQILLKRRE
jgi:hypothetical protein